MAIPWDQCLIPLIIQIASHLKSLIVFMGLALGAIRLVQYGPDALLFIFASFSISPRLDACA